MLNFIRRIWADLIGDMPTRVRPTKPWPNPPCAPRNAEPSNNIAEAAIGALTGRRMGLNRVEAKHLVETAMKRDDKIATVEAAIRGALALRPIKH